MRLRCSFAAACLLIVGLNAVAQRVLVPGTPFERRQVADELGRKISYYISRPKAPPAPLLLMIQGSGCVPLMNVQPSGTYSTLFNLGPFAAEGRFTVIAVEKPYAAAHAGPPGSAKACSQEFNEDFTAERWLIALKTALDDARHSEWVDAKRTVVLGLSEGAVMASLLASHDAAVTDVIMVGGSGTTQLFDFVALAYKGCFDVPRCLAEIEDNVRRIKADPTSSTNLAWGHPYRRWTSFFAVDPSEELLRSKARVYLAFGTADDSVAPLSVELAAARLVVANRDVTVRRVVNGNHTLMQSPSDWSDLDRELRAALDWYWERHPQ